MAGRKRSDLSARNKHVVQVCLSELLVHELQEYADLEHDGRLSVAARELLAEQLMAVS